MHQRVSKLSQNGGTLPSGVSQVAQDNCWKNAFLTFFLFHNGLLQ